MTQPTAASAIVNFLDNRKNILTQDLLDRYLKYGTAMETQVLVDAGRGEPVDGKRNTYTDGLETWFSYRIPYDADSDPHWDDYPLRWALDEHAKGIGCTGWDWQSKVSRWVGYDIDTIVGHAPGVGIADAEIEKVCKAVEQLPYVEIRRSSRGGGRHLYIQLDGYPTENHTVHAALARCLLGVMSQDAGFQFDARNGNKIVDACGSNMWIWHRYANAENQGLSLLKSATETFPESRIPPNWRDHIDVVTRRRQRIRVAGVAETEEDAFVELASAYRRVELDATHRQIMEELANSGVTTIWVPEMHLLQTHTHGFKRIFESGKYTGVYDTSSPGSDLTTPNCFAFPLDHGAWRIHRFGKGTHEAVNWEQDGEGYTTCGFNITPPTKIAARAKGGKALIAGGYEFKTLEQAAEVAELVGSPVDVDDRLRHRATVLKTSKDGNLIFQVRREESDPDLPDWNGSDKKNHWTRVVDAPTQPNRVDTVDCDSVVRCLTTPNFTPAGWAVKSLGDESPWLRKQASSVKTVLQDLGYSKPEAEQLMGRAERRPWTIVQIPFREEYLANRQWNLNAPQLKVPPAPRSGDMESRHPTWDKVLNHAGRDLDRAIKELPWAQLCNIRTGGDYLKAAYAIMIRDPQARLPWMFFFSPEEGTGKSTVHEVLNLLFTHGVVRAEGALTTEFNGELHGAIACVVEELDLSGNKKVHAKLKNYITADTIAIRKLYEGAMMVANTSHWFQTANDISYCPIIEGDTRITVVRVYPIPEDQMIAKAVLMQRLEAEAPEFLRTLLDMELPPPSLDRLRLPVVETEHKRHQQILNRTPLEVFLSEHVYYVPGEMVTFAEFYKRFQDTLTPQDRAHWSKIKVSKRLPEKHKSGAATANVAHVINCAWEAKESNALPLVVVDGKVRQG